MAQFIINPSKHLGLHLTGPPGNTVPTLSLGGTISINAFVDQSQLLQDVEYADRTHGLSTYRGVYLANLINLETSEGIPGEYTFEDVKIWIADSSSGPTDDIYIATDSLGMKTGSLTMSSISHDWDSPIVSHWYGYNQTVSLGDFTVGSGRGLWIRRFCSPGGSAYKNSTARIMITADIRSGVQYV